MQPCLIGRHVVRLASVTSTNDVAFELAERGASEGTVVLADVQTRGRGRQGRPWHAAPHSSVLLSTILRPGASCQRTTLLSAMAAVAAYETVAAQSGLETMIKWPNDIHILGRKVSGILIEQRREVCVIGIGINVNQTEKELQAAELPEAISLRTACFREFSTEAVATDVMQHLDSAYGELLHAGHERLLEKWIAATRLEGAQVKIRHPGGEAVGRVLAMDFDELRLVPLPVREFSCSPCPLPAKRGDRGERARRLPAKRGQRRMERETPRVETALEGAAASPVAFNLSHVQAIQRLV
jgi:BirA family biotin operon repressor/biotin-[acetyl-CoA-carboxylase] ligase